MSNLFFLGIEDVMTIIQGEMPQGVYAQDRADNFDPNKRSYSSSELRTVAQMYANLYANLQDIWEDKFLSTLQPDAIGDWEADLFSTPQNANLPFTTRQQNALTKYRATGGLSYPYINSLISSILTPLGLSWLLVPYSGGYLYAWVLEQSSLDTDTYLSLEDPIYGKQVGIYNLDCNSQILTTGNTVATSYIVSNIPSVIVANIEMGAGVSGVGIPSGAVVVAIGSNNVTLNMAATLTQTGVSLLIQNYIAAGLTYADLQNIQATAYTYAVYIYGIADAQTLSTLEQTLTAFEPAGTTFQIFNNTAPIPINPQILDLGGGSECSLEDSYDCGFGTMGATFNVWDMSL